MTVTWEDPAANPRLKYDHEGIASALKSRPGEWALVLSDVPYTIANQIKRGALKHYRPIGAFETRTSGNDQSTGRAAKIYARYVGEGN